MKKNSATGSHSVFSIPMEGKNEKLFLGIDGGQSHTEAVIADEHGNILGSGLSGPSNHAEQPGGRERLRAAVIESTAVALAEFWSGKSELSGASRDPSTFEFAGVHCGMTGSADFKEAVIAGVLRTSKLTVGHDAPTALAGALGGNPGIVVIAGTGSVVYGENSDGKSVQIGGLGYIFSDEGSGFWLAAQAIRFAIKEQDGLIDDSDLCALVREFFGVTEIRQLTTAFYAGSIDRMQVASFAARVAEAAENGNGVLGNEIEKGARSLAESVKVAADRLGYFDRFQVSGVGGMFRGTLLRKFFDNILQSTVTGASIVEPRFGPAIGALIMAYRNMEIAITDDLLARLDQT